MLSRICGAKLLQAFATSMRSWPVRVAKMVSPDDAERRSGSPQCSAFAAQQERRKVDPDGTADVPSISVAGSIPGASNSTRAALREILEGLYLFGGIGFTGEVETLQLVQT